MRDQISHPHKTTEEIVILYILIFKFLSRKWEDKIFWSELWKEFYEFNLLLISFWMQFWFVTVVPMYLKFATYSEDLLAVSSKKE
jgi:hypothetical protein